MQRARLLLMSCTLLTTLSVFAVPGPAHAQDVDKKVTLNLKDIPLKSAIDALFAGTGLQYSVDPNVQNVPVNLTIRDVGLQAALRLLIRQAATLQPGLTFSKDGDIYVIKIRKEAPQSAAPTEEAPPEYTDQATEFNWERIPIQFNNVAVFTLAFG
jgi:type II secretory pathway component GspD/PulD (secretin)